MNEETIKYPVGTQDFAKLREFNYIYVDKTELIYKLISNNNCVFLSRPRRFGKSLLLSTIRYFFEGRKDLFQGLKIVDLEKEWKKFPVLLLELSRSEARNHESLKSTIEEQFRVWEKQYGITDTHLDYSSRFSQIIRTIYEVTGERVVVLIDEYDNPLINNIHDPGIYEKNHSLLKSIYSNLKAMDSYIRFAMLTGVSRFSNTSIFSGLNNIQDISFWEDFSTICGFTSDEIFRYLWKGIEALSKKSNVRAEEMISRLKRAYDGYHFSEDMTDIYNPFSLLCCLNTRRIDNYWFQSGVPEFLSRNLQQNKMSFQKLFTAEGTPTSLSVADVAFKSPVALFYQTGYLTIKSYDKETERFCLGIPNREVDEGLFSYLLGGYYDNDPLDAENDIKKIARSFQEGNPKEAIERLRSLLGGISYNLNEKMSEVDFERTMYVIFHILGFHVHSQLSTSNGRIDLTVETKDYVYVIELKLDKSAEEALRQIDSKDYTLRWKFDNRKIYKIGISFSSHTRNISSFLIH